MKYLMFNLKNNLNLQEILEYKHSIHDLDFRNYTFILFPSSIYLPFFYHEKYPLGVQNLSLYDNEIKTGEILPSQLKSLRISYTLLNHAEVEDTLDNVIKKIKIAYQNGIKVVLILGEEKETSLEEVLSYLTNQIQFIFSRLKIEEIKNCILTYEPSWLICQSHGIDVHTLEIIITKLKQYMKANYQISLPICYGGSINDENIQKLLQIDKLDGYLIGNFAKNPKNVVKLLSNL